MSEYRVYAPEVFEFLDGRSYVAKPCLRCEWVDTTTYGDMPTQWFLVGQPCPEHIRTMPEGFR